MSELAVKPLPRSRRGRLWIILLFGLALFGLGYLVVQVATQTPEDDVIKVEGINEAQEIFGGIPQEGDRFGSSDAPVSVQLFNDVQCSSCSEDFLTAIPTLAEKYARPGDVQFLYRHYSNSESVREIGFYGAEAAALQGYGWQYIYLFFKNQDESERLGTVSEDFLASIAGGVEELNAPEWEKAMETETAEDSPISQKLDEYEELGRDLGIRYGQAAIVSGPNGTRTIQDGAKLGQIEKAIAEVE